MYPYSPNPSKKSYSHESQNKQQKNIFSPSHHLQEQQIRSEQENRIQQLKQRIQHMKQVNEEKRQELEYVNECIRKIHEKQNMMPLIQQLKEHFRQLKESLGSDVYLEDDQVDVDAMSYEELLELGEKIGKVSRGITKEQFNSLPQVYPPIATQCSICQEDLSLNKKALSLKCNHWFDVECIEEWLKREKHCPLCKKEIF